MVCSHCPTLIPIKVGYIELCGGSHTAQRQTLRKISIEFCVNLSVSVSVSVSVSDTITIKAHSHQASMTNLEPQTSRLASYLISWGFNRFWSDSLGLLRNLLRNLSNQSNVTRDIAALTLTLSVNKPLNAKISEINHTT